MGYLLRTLLGDLEVLGLKVVEEISSLKVLHDDVDVVRVFEDIMKPNDIWMLAHFQNFNFPLKQFQVL